MELPIALDRGQVDLTVLLASGPRFNENSLIYRRLRDVSCCSAFFTAPFVEFESRHKNTLPLVELLTTSSLRSQRNGSSGAQPPPEMNPFLRPSLNVWQIESKQPRCHISSKTFYYFRSSFPLPCPFASFHISPKILCCSHADNLESAL